MPLDPNMPLDSAVPSQSNYLQKSDVGETGVDLTIKALDRDQVDEKDPNSVKTVIHWVQPNYKPLVLNKTNKNRLTVILKATTVGDLIGKTVNVYNDPMVEFGGEITGGIRIRAAAEAAPAETAPPDDSIPF